jgi:hypothetical protein
MTPSGFDAALLYAGKRPDLSLTIKKADVFELVLSCILT